MTPIQLTEDQHDMLMEVVNLAMGKAGSDLAAILKSFVDLAVPRVDIIAAEVLVDKVLEESVFDPAAPVTLLGQRFSNQAFVDGEAMVIFDHKTREQFAGILGFSGPMDRVEELDFMLELTNIMTGACLNSISDQLFGREMSFSPPELASEHLTLQETVYNRFKRRHLKWDHTLMAKITFNLKDRSFKSDLLIFISQTAIQAIHTSLNRLLAEFE